MPKKRACVCLMALAAIAGTLTGCGSSSSSTAPTKYVAVADSNNSRVLLYTVPVSSGQAASIVLGQADFTSNTGATSATGLYYPVKATVDSTGNIWVADCSSSRVVEYKAPFSNGMSASLVLGEPDMNTSSGGASATSLDCPSGLEFDSQGNLWVTDYDNSRVVEYKAPFTSGMAASIALGQTDLNSSTCATSASGLCYPWEGLAFDGKGNLFVGDYDNCRILEYQPPFTTGMAATVAIGQTDLTSGSCGTTASTLDSPLGLAFDGSGNLWTGDYTNNRVLEFKAPFTTGMSASLVIGQTDFTSSASSTTASGLSDPYDVSFDSSGNLYVADYDNNRTVMFSGPFSNGMSATKVLGAPDFVTSTCGTTSATVCYPNGATAIQ
ncbi:MAG TPA: NHL repeat-containing protein [Candidatus Acidoferrales bacterium]|nr:NHL repeat-containing protein [Candidatus Acidoferrales bacterium]